MYSNVICIGDSYTNEIECYRNQNHLKTFEEVGYEFKSYPQLLGEHYNCKWETFGEPGMPMVFTLQTLIDKIPYILSLDNPLVIYQFGFFTNLILHVEADKWMNWKSLTGTDVSENFLKQQFQTQTQFGVVTANNEHIGTKEDEILLLDYTNKFGENTNYFIIQYFCTIADILTKLGKPNIFGMFLPKPDGFKFPTHKNLLPHLHEWHMPEIKDVIEQVNDTHKSTEANEKLSKHIIDNLPKNFSQYEKLSKDVIKNITK